MLDKLLCLLGLHKTAITDKWESNGPDPTMITAWESRLSCIRCKRTLAYIRVEYDPITGRIKEDDVERAA